MRFAAAAFALLVVVAAGAGASASAGSGPQNGCPRDPSLGVVRFQRGAHEHVVSLANCTDRITGAATPWKPPGSFRSSTGLVAAVRTVGLRSKHGSETITVDGRAVYRVAERYDTPGPIILAGWSPDSRSILFSIDPLSSASLMADGLQLRALEVASGRVTPVAFMLLDYDYLTWCGSTLVLSAGGDRVSTTNKRLVVANAPTWKPHALWVDRRRAFGSLACAPDGKSMAVLSQPASDDANFFHTNWELWRIALDGSRTLLDAPPAGFADESPRWSRDGSALLFVRERKGYGQLMLLRDGNVTGPLANLGYSLGYYGHHDWWLGASWSAGA